jgi:hypothetical protein
MFFYDFITLLLYYIIALLLYDFIAVWWDLPADGGGRLSACPQAHPAAG